MDITWLLPILMYAETHYRFRYFFSYLKKDEPEIVADAPHRIEPGNDIPLLILVKDSHLYPSILHQIAVTISQDGDKETNRKLLNRPVRLAKKWWWSIYRIPPQSRKGWISLDVQLDIESFGRRRIYHNDNYRTSSRRPLRVFLSESPLPRLPGLHFGDGHVHSEYTDDQVEYGAPPAASVILSKAIGLSFFSITDHSYDLDDNVNDYLRNDPSLPKWKSLQREVSLLNRRHHKHKILLGEEVSCRNSRGENVHLLLYGNRQYVAGSGDSAERWFHTKSDLSIRDILDGRSDAIALAAHPREQVPFLQKLLLRRGVWTHGDLRIPGITGMQFLNGELGVGFERGRREWIRLLLSGARITTGAGNDSHGNFNRFRQIGFPFFLIKEHHQQLFGKMRTGLFLGSNLSEASIMRAIRQGRGIISDGPVAIIRATNEAGETFSLGECVSGRWAAIHLRAESSGEFGVIEFVDLYCGLLGRKREELIFHSENIGNFKFEHTLSFNLVQAGYLRLEVKTSRQNTCDNSAHFCLTNPLWFDCNVERK